MSWVWGCLGINVIIFTEVGQPVFVLKENPISRFLLPAVQALCHMAKIRNLWVCHFFLSCWFQRVYIAWRVWLQHSSDGIGEDKGSRSLAAKVLRLAARLRELIILWCCDPSFNGTTRMFTYTKPWTRDETRHNFSYYSLVNCFYTKVLKVI